MLLIIFAKNPILGKVKTRIAKDIGDEKALQVYKKLLEHTCAVAQEAECTRWIFYSDYIEMNDCFDPHKFTKKVQSNTDLGTRMQNAFQEGFDAGFERIVIIGSDCYELQPVFINEAFHILGHKEVVIGPAYDGGYYLLGLRYMYSQLFMDKHWSTESVLHDTVEDIHELELKYDLLTPLSDVDFYNDIPDDIKTLLDI